MRFKDRFGRWSLGGGGVLLTRLVEPCRRRSVPICGGGSEDIVCGGGGGV